MNLKNLKNLLMQRDHAVARPRIKQLHDRLQMPSIRDQQIPRAPETLTLYRQHLCALRQIINVVDPQQAQANVAIRVVLVPMLLALLPHGELFPLDTRPRIARKHDIAREAQHSLRQRSETEGLVVEQRVPDSELR